jgi:hypothetical protein
VILSGFLSGDIIGLVFVIAFCALIIIFTIIGRRRPKPNLREIRAFARVGNAIGKAVEAGKRLHISIGWGKISGLQGGSSLIGLSVLERISRTASISDRPPIATSGNGSLTIMSQDTLRGTLHEINADSQYDPDSGRVTGLTPYSYAAGTIPVIYDDQVSTTIIAGHFGSEVALITDASERINALSLAGSDDISAQAVLYATADEPLIGEEIFAAGAYLKAGPVHAASLHAQDVFRWVLSGIILVGALLKFFGLI